jgi:hypothetical protein
MLVDGNEEVWRYGGDMEGRHIQDMGSGKWASVAPKRKYTDRVHLKVYGQFG